MTGSHSVKDSQSEERKSDGSATPHGIRQPFVAMMLSLLAVGVGHIYSGRVVLGTVLFAVWLALLPAWYLLSIVSPSHIAFWGLFVAPLCLLLLTYVVAAIHAYRLAGRQADYRLRDYNHPLVYTALVLVGLCYPLSVAVASRTYLWEAYYIPTSSMAPTIASGDRVLCNHRRYRDREISRGDLIVFIPPEHPERRHIKRVIAIGGDRVSMQDGKLLVNGKVARYEPPLNEAGTYRESTAASVNVVSYLHPPQGQDFAEMQVPAEHLFVLGDRRDNSLDSRHYGAVSQQRVVGRVEYRHTAGSLERIGPVQ